MEVGGVRTYPLAFQALEILQYGGHRFALQWVDETVLDLGHVVRRLARRTAPHATPETQTRRDVSRSDCARFPSCRTPPCMPYNDWQQLVVWLQLVVICPTTVYSWSVTDYSWSLTDNSWSLTDYSWLLTDYSWSSSERSWWKQATDCCWVGWNRGQEKIGTSGTRCCNLKTGLRASYVTRQQQA